MRQCGCGRAGCTLDGMRADAKYRSRACAMHRKRALARGHDPDLESKSDAFWKGVHSVLRSSVRTERERSATAGS